jgi:two-component system, sensor histidine kinase and response regulator
MTRILVIDDDPNFLMTLKALLESYNFTVTTASNGAEGIQLAQELTPDIVLSDINMPGMTGFEIFQKLQEAASTRTIPFIFISGRDDMDSFRKGMQLGANDYLTKPFSSEDLLNAINIRLKQHEALENKYASTMTLLRKNISYALPHELRTPLTAILGYGALLKSEYETMEREEIGMFAEEIVKGGNRLYRVIENYLVYIQLELITSNPKEVEAMRRHLVLADKVIPKYAEEIIVQHERYEDLLMDLAPNLGLRISDENLGKIITELVDNSCRFSKAGTPISIRAYREPETVVIEIQDSGRGMSPQQIADIGAFMQFERGIYEQQGMGLGLSIAIKLCELHNGSLHLDSKKDVGTRVLLRFHR